MTIPKQTTKAKPKVSARPAPVKSSVRYHEGVGRRKTAIARVRISKGTGEVVVNEKSLAAYFQLPRLQALVTAPFEKLSFTGEFDVSARVQGGGINAQAEAIRLGVARALVLFDETLKKKLRAFGFMTRDPRMVERKKYGLKKARRSPQWSKR
ncbi:MAG: 30S ribosomal protein S9 [Patescibacteria group bacterium]